MPDIFEEKPDNYEGSKRKYLDDALSKGVVPSMDIRTLTENGAHYTYYPGDRNEIVRRLTGEIVGMIAVADNWISKYNIGWQNAMSAALVLGPAFIEEFRTEGVLNQVSDSYAGEVSTFLRHIHLFAGNYGHQAALIVDPLRNSGFRFSMLSDDYYLEILREHGIISSQGGKVNKLLENMPFQLSPLDFFNELQTRLTTYYAPNYFRAKASANPTRYVHCPASVIMRNAAQVCVLNRYLYLRKKEKIEITKELLVGKDAVKLKFLTILY